MDDRDRIKRERELDRISDGSKVGVFVFRDRFIEEKDAEIARIIWNYFKAVEERWPKAWNNIEKGMILPRTTGFAALVRVLPDIINKLGVRTGVYKQEEFLVFLKKASLKDAEFTSDNFKPGSAGEGELVRRLRVDMIGT